MMRFLLWLFFRDGGAMCLSLRSLNIAYFASFVSLAVAGAYLVLS